jgi:transcriptional regulator with XRE-family HTH domain
MAAKGVNQSEIVKACGFQTGTVSRYFSGDSVPKAMELYKLAKYFGVSMEWLLVGDEEREPESLKTNKAVIPYEVKGKLSQKSLEMIFSALEDFQSTLDRVKETLPEKKKTETKSDE